MPSDGPTSEVVAFRKKPEILHGAGIGAGRERGLSHLFQVRAIIVRRRQDLRRIPDRAEQGDVARLPTRCALRQLRRAPPQRRYRFNERIAHAAALADNRRDVDDPVFADQAVVITEAT